MANWFFTKTVNAASGTNPTTFIQLNSAISQQVRVQFFPTANVTMVKAASAGEALSENGADYRYLAAANATQSIVCNPSTTWIRNDSITTTSSIYCIAWTLENQDLA